MTQCIISVIILVVIFGVFGVRSEIFTAMSDVEALIESEREVVSILRNLVQAEKKKLSVIESYIDNFADVYEDKPDKDILRYVSHPVNAFTLVKRLGVEWTVVNNLLKTHLGNVGLEEIERRRQHIKLPDAEEDMKGAAEAIVRLQHTYNLEEKVIASGEIPGLITKSPALTALDCYLLGYHQAQLGFHDYAIEWLQIALVKHDEEKKAGIPQKIEKPQILDWLQHSVFHFGNVSRALSISESLEEISPDFPNANANTKFYRQVLSNMSDETLDHMSKAPARRKLPSGNYEALCRGEGVIPTKMEKDFSCYLENYGNPWLLLQPVKTEVVYKSPEIYVLHDVLFHSQLDRVKNVAKYQLQRAMVVKPGTDQFEYTKIRISKREDSDPIVRQINERIGIVTNMDMEIAEDLQLANYGIGGHYDPHFDHFRTVNQINRKQMDPRLGDRIATFLLYMTDVEAGGATVFPRINLTLYPEKGSAAYWFNLHRDGLGDENTLHAGCPVLCGTKWISNKWIREKWQDVTRPRGLQPDSPEWKDGWPDPESE